MNIKIGDAVFIVYPKRNVRTYNEEVTHIGRKWATLSGNHPKMNIEDWSLDGGKYSSPGQVYKSESDYREQMYLNAVWREFKNSLAYTPPPNLSASEIIEIATRFGITIKASK